MSTWKYIIISKQTGGVSGTNDPAVVDSLSQAVDHLFIDAEHGLLLDNNVSGPGRSIDIPEAMLPDSAPEVTPPH